MFEKLKEENKFKLEEFEKELSFIQNLRIKNITEIAICHIHPLFFKLEASSTGKYHPAYGSGKRGLLRHTRAAVNIAQLLRTINSFELSDIELDIAIAALILHDSCKRGIHFECSYTMHEHPLVVYMLVPRDTFLGEDEVLWKRICDAISTHMGQWTQKDGSTITLPKPETAIQKFVHEADYLASRKIISIDNIWSKEDSEIIKEEELKKIEKEQNKKEEPMTVPQETYIKKLVEEYKDSCDKLLISCPYSSNNLSFLTKRTASGYIGKIKNLLEKNQKLLAEKH